MSMSTVFKGRTSVVSFLPSVVLCIGYRQKRAPCRESSLCDQPTLLGPAGFRVHYVNKDLKAVTSAI